jgi:hypothetical protein
MHMTCEKSMLSCQATNQDVSPSASDVHHYILIRKLLDSIFSNYQYSDASGKFKHAELILYR